MRAGPERSEEPRPGRRFATTSEALASLVIAKREQSQPATGKVDPDYRTGVATCSGCLCILSITAAFVRLGGALGLTRSVAQSYRGFMVGVRHSVVVAGGIYYVFET